MVALRRPSRNRCLRLVLVAVALTLARAATLPAADFLDSYKGGLRAAEDGDWAKVAEDMRQAIAGRSESTVRLTKSFYFKRYIPHYYLGRALFETGDCPAALQAWQEAERQGVIQRFPEYQDLQTKRALCRQRQEQVATDLDAAREEVRKAAAAADALERRRQAGPAALWQGGSPSLADRLAAAKALIEKARKQLAAGSEPANGKLLEEARQSAAESRQQLVEVGQEADRGRRRLSTARRNLRTSLAALAGEAREALSKATYLAPYPPGVASRRAELSAAIAAAATADDATGSGHLEDLAARLRKALDDFRRSVSPPPPVLSTAAEALFGGRYKEVLEILADPELPDPRAEAQAHLFRAAADYALYLTGSDGQRLAAARREVVACRQSDPTAAPLESAFSPRFVAFFASVAAPDGDVPP